MKTKTAIVVATIVLTIVIGVVVPAMAAPSAQDLPPVSEIPTLADFLDQLASAAGLAAAGAVVALVLERIPAFQSLNSDTKFSVSIVVTTVLAIGARLILQFVPASWLQAIEAYWQLIAAAVVTWLGSQVMHRMDRK